MLIAPGQVRSRIDTAINRLRAQEADLAGHLAELSTRMTRLKEQEAGEYRRLARLRLDTLERERVSGPLEAAERAALATLRSGAERLSRIEAEQRELAGERTRAEDTRAEAEARLEAAEQAVEALAEATRARLSQTPDWQAMATAAEQARSVADNAERKAAAAEADRAEKETPYKADPLFAYLWERGYGTPRYRAMAIVRHGDERVARLIGFRAAREAFYRLNEIPRRLRAHAGRVAAEAQRAEAALVVHERAALEADGIAGPEADFAAAESALTEAEAAVGALVAKADTLAAEAAALVGPETNPALADALEALARALERAGLGKLRARAAATPDAEDDSSVARLEILDADRRAIAREIEETRARQGDVAARLAEMEAERHSFRRAGYSEPGGGFENGDAIGEILGGMVKGALRSCTLHDALRGGYRGPRRSRPRIGLPRGRGGGFRTGGGF
jgi:hypothetical protein